MYLAGVRPCIYENEMQRGHLTEAVSIVRIVMPDFEPVNCQIQNQFRISKDFTHNFMHDVLIHQHVRLTRQPFCKLFSLKQLCLIPSLQSKQTGAASDWNECQNVR